MSKFTTAMVLVIVVLSVGVTWQAIADGTPEMREYVNESADWCDERGGDLINSHVVGSHGGLHCELPNGTSVHMDEVIDRA